MDEMKLSLSTKFMRGVLAKVISKMIKKKYGHKVDIYFSQINLDIVDGQAHLHMDVDLELDSDEFKSIMKSITED